MPSLSRSSGTFELLHEFLHPFGLHLCQIGLVDVVHGESLKEGNDIHAFLLLLAHGLILLRTDLMAVLVLDQHIPIDHRKAFFTFQYMGLEVVRLLEGEVHRQSVALGSGLQLKEEGIGTRVVAASTFCGRPANPDAPPIQPFFQSEAFICSMRAIIISAKRSMATCPALPDVLVPYAIAFVIHYLTVHLVNVRLFDIKLCGFIRRIRAVVWHHSR